MFVPPLVCVSVSHFSFVRHVFACVVWSIASPLAGECTVLCCSNSPVFLLLSTHTQAVQLSDLDPLAANIENCVGPLSPKLEAFRLFLEGSTADQEGAGVSVKNLAFCVEVEKFKSMVSAAADVVSDSCA